MYHNLLLAFILLHVLGDFYFQSEALVSSKDGSYRAVLLHSAICTAVLVTGMLPVFSFPIAMAVAALSLLHFVIDSAKFLFCQRQRRVSDPFNSSARSSGSSLPSC